jgi:hypothetical protein
MSPSVPPNNSLQPWTPAPHRRCDEDTCPRVPAAQCRQNAHLPSRKDTGTVWRAVPGGAGSWTDPAGVRKVEGALPARMRGNG